jgi:holo-[acyl-carrier protein] synthase
MIVSIGIDIMDVERIAQSLGRSERLRDRIFTPAEIAYCEQHASKYEHYAGRFAAKEAALKALRTGWSGGIGWHDVEILPSDQGPPELVITGRARNRLDEMGVTNWHISLSHTKSHAVAQVVLEKL